MYDTIKQWAEADGLVAKNYEDRVALIGTGKIGADGLCGWIPVRVSYPELEQNQDAETMEMLLASRYSLAKKTLRENGEL